MTVQPRILVIAGVGLRLILRDRTALFFTAVLPFMIILVVGSVTGGDDPVRVGVVRADRSAAADELITQLRATEALDVAEVASADAAIRAVRRGRLAASLTIPAGLGEDLAAGRAVQLELLAPVDRPTSSVVRAAVSGMLQERSSRLAAAQAVTGPPLAERLAATEQTGEAMAGPRLESRVHGAAAAQTTNPFSHTAPANLVLFVFVTSLAVGAAMIESRRLGILRRMLASPTSVAAVLFGSALSRLLVAVAQAVLILVLGRFVFGVRWGDPLAAAALVFVFAIVSVGAGLLISTVFRSAEQASSVAPPLGIALGMLGGCMWPLSIVGPLMQRVGHVTPHAWAMDGWRKVVEDGASVVDIGSQLAVLAAFAVVLFGFGLARLRRELTAGF